MKLIHNDKEFNIIFKCIVGSVAYGTNIETSDIDVKGVYIQDKNDILGYNYIPQIEVDKDTVYYEIGRFIQLLETANPTVLEMLFSDEKNILFKDKLFDILLENRFSFLTKKCRHSFGGMAISQITKSKGTNKKFNWEQESIKRKTPLDFCTFYDEGIVVDLISYLEKRNLKQESCGLTKLDRMKDCYNIFYSKEFKYRGIAFEESNHIRLSEIPKGQVPMGLVCYNLDAYEQHCRKYKEYQIWLQNRNMTRFVETKNSGQMIDGKNLMHCIRLLEMVEEIFTLKNLTVLRPNRDYLLSIRKGELNLQDIIKIAEQKILSLDLLVEHSDLEETVTKLFTHNLLIKIRNETN